MAISARTKRLLMDVLTDASAVDDLVVSIGSGGGGGGSQGIQGIQGIQGVPGAAGSNWETTLVPPVLSAYTWVNQGTATAVDDGKGIYMVAAPAAQHDQKQLLIATGVPPWTYTSKAIPGVVTANSGNCGISWCSGAGGHTHQIRFLGGLEVAVSEFNSPTSYAGEDVTAFYTDPSFRWIKVHNDGTSIFVSIGIDGVNWVLVATLAVSYLGAPFDHVGPFVEGSTATWPAVMRLVSAQLVSS